ncbi:SCO4402 family protein [Methylobrevis albus]|uniref:Uncharacterized protein n=1 Tax=Methylobrevis albus TaxID=2793297 RepID=A0A931I4Z0_9HYPH|nr:hypothetical protein [Methylobrevis albus]MBH0238941.1 hypothetical protein [Methylobrevis albus]
MVKYESMRAELLGTLRCLGNARCQIDCWVHGKFPAGVEYEDFGLHVHFLFDDTLLSEDPERTIGFILETAAEAAAIKKLCDSLELIFGRYGTELADADDISKPEWVDVIRSAREASDVFGL